MKVCMFTNTYIPQIGGVARSVLTLAEDLQNLGHSVLIVAPTYAAQQEAPEPLDALRVPAIQNFNGSDFSLRIPLPFIIRDRLDAFRPDLIHSHHPYLLGDAALREARRRGVPLESSGLRPPILVREAFPVLTQFALFLQCVTFAEFVVVRALLNTFQDITHMWTTRP